MISVVKRFHSDSFDVVMHYDNVCECYTVRVVYCDSQRNFFFRDYRSKGSAVRAYNSWVAKISAVCQRVREVHDVQ